jgi:hypothetical protein
MRKLLLSATLCFVFILLQLKTNAQSDKQFFVAVTPSYEAIFSQVEIRAESVNLGFGLFNQYKFHISGNIKYSFGKSLPEPNKRTVTFNRFSPGIKMKWLVLGKNKYMSDKYFDNMRLCLDIASHYNFAYTQLYREDVLADQKLVPYLSADLGFSLLIPYGFVAKNTIHILNHSDLYLEVFGTAIVHTDIAIINAPSSTIDQVTTAGRLCLNWMYYF